MSPLKPLPGGRRGPGAAATLLLAASATACGAEAPASELFALRATQPSLFLYDVGVADVDGDQRLDVYTSNHNLQQQLLCNAGEWRFEDGYAALGLHQDPRYPGLEGSLQTPPVAPDSLHVYWRSRRLVLEARELGDPDAYRGQLTIYGTVAIEGADGFSAETEERALGEDASQTVLSFAPEASGTLTLHPFLPSQPIRIRFEAPAEGARRVFVGRSGTPVAGPEFTFTLRDRHSLAWADVDGDGALDVFIGRGGLKGRKALYPFEAVDELFVRRGAAFREVARDFGFAPRSDRVRRSQWFDVDGDGWLDLFAACKGPLRLYRRSGERFEEVAEQTGLGGVETQMVAVANLSGRRTSDLLVADILGVDHYVLRGGRYRHVGRFPSLGAYRRFAFGDFDGDGDRDVLVTSLLEALLLTADGPRLVPTSLADLGLPTAMEDASWVDFDNDGDDDLYVYPGGLYRRTGPRAFEPTDLAPPLRVYREAPATDGEEEEVVRKIPNALDTYASWADFDGDGDRDLVRATRVAREPDTYDLELYENLSPPAHWLQVRLRGPEGNREAIGASVRVETASGKRQTRWVGDAEGAVRSQGHYRLYFGLGAESGPVDVRVVWPDGRVQELSGVAVDQLRTVESDARN